MNGAWVEFILAFLDTRSVLGAHLLILYSNSTVFRELLS